MNTTSATLLDRYSSSLQTIEIYQSNDHRVLRTGEHIIQSTLSLRHPEQLVLSYMQAMMTILLFRPQPKTALLLGLGGGDLVRFLHHHVSQIDITAVEIDPGMVEICRKYFALPASEKIKLYTEDAMLFLQENHLRYDLLLADMYLNSKAPGFLQQDIFYQHCYQHLTTDGVLAINLLTTDAEYFRRTLWTIRQTFAQSTLCLTVPGNVNILVFAFQKRPALLTAPALLAKAKHGKEKFNLDLSKWVTQLFTTNPTRDGKLIF